MGRLRLPAVLVLLLSALVLPAVAGATPPQKGARYGGLIAVQHFPEQDVEFPISFTVDPTGREVESISLRCLVAGYGLERADHEEFVDAIIEAQRVGNAFVRRRVEAREPGFVAMWQERGGAEWFDGATAWMEGQRSHWLEALRV